MYRFKRRRDNHINPYAAGGEFGQYKIMQKKTKK